MEQLGIRKAEMSDMRPDSKGRMRLDFGDPQSGLNWFSNRVYDLTSGAGLIYHTFDHYGPYAGGASTTSKRRFDCQCSGKKLRLCLFNLQERGQMIIGPGEEIYEGIGIHTRSNDLTVNALKAKQLTNIRASGTDENIQLTPPTRFTLEQALEFIDDDELVDPNHSIRKTFI